MRAPRSSSSAAAAKRPGMRSTRLNGHVAGAVDKQTDLGVGCCKDLVCGTTDGPVVTQIDLDEGSLDNRIDSLNLG
ncbi:hypothetical protein HG530_008066 [Fusarium avenaceum]|nr:hypothetical protein HG530_008066 [Fusarium avenaceum]